MVLEETSTKSNIMNTHILSALAISGLLAGSALAGPGDAHSPFAYHPAGNAAGIALFKGSKAANCPMIKEQAKILPSASAKNPSVTKVVTGYMHEGCATNAAGTVVCKGSNETCAAMLKRS